MLPEPKVINYSDNDVLVFSFAERISEKVFDLLNEQFKSKFPNMKAIFLENGASVSVLHKQQNVLDEEEYF